MKKVGVLLVVIGVIGMVFTAKQFFSREKVEEKVYFSGEQYDHIIAQGDKANVTILPSSSNEIEVSWKGSIFNQS